MSLCELKLKGNRMKNDVKRDLKQKQVNKSHIDYLQFRLDMVARNANGKKRKTGSTMTYEMVAKREDRRQAKANNRQFGSFRSSVTGKSLTYLKDGEYLPR